MRVAEILHPTLGVYQDHDFDTLNPLIKPEFDK